MRRGVWKRTPTSGAQSEGDEGEEVGLELANIDMHLCVKREEGRRQGDEEVGAGGSVGREKTRKQKETGEKTTTHLASMQQKQTHQVVPGARGRVRQHKRAMQHAIGGAEGRGLHKHWMGDEHGRGGKFREDRGRRTSSVQTMRDE